MRAIDLYAGIGGWALGLKMAGIDVVASYEWWGPAAATHRANLPGTVHEVDIRAMPLSELPKNIDVVVGSPPCTQFSYANRGGSGDIADGLKDLYRFFEVVRHLKPKHWAMENVPRVADVISKESLPGGALEEFRDLIDSAAIQVVDMSLFGVPQRRKRCVVGNFDPDSLLAWSKRAQPRTLGDVLTHLQRNEDPNYFGYRTNELTEMENEQPLNLEEVRFNREMKAHHPIYNGMAFPEDISRPSRTITATCTRVSRESLIIESQNGGFRRLNVRERGSLQGFPISYQFHGKSHPEKLKMIGNAIPPIFTYYIAQCFQSRHAEMSILANQIDANVFIQNSSSTKTSPDAENPLYRMERRFRFAIPSLRFKSGVRFDLTNEAEDLPWRVEFYFGDSKRIQKRVFDSSDMHQIGLFSERSKAFIQRVYELVDKTDLYTLQLVWAHQIELDQPHPFRLIDELGSISEELASGINNQADLSKVQDFVIQMLANTNGDVLGERKLRLNAPSVWAGALVASAFNSACSECVRRAAA